MIRIINHIFKYKTKYIISALLLIIVALFSVILFCNFKKENMIENLSKSVFMLEIYDVNNELTNIGSGFIVFQDDILVTNYHVIENAFKINAIGENDVIYSLDNVIAFDVNKDLALLKFSTSTNLTPLELYDSSKISKGDEVIAIGSPLGLKNTVSKGIVSAVREDKNDEIIQITAPISSGSSGGALLNASGKVFGVTFAGIEDGQNINLAIPSNNIKELYKSKSNEMDIESFFFEQNPVEGYKLECEHVEISDIFNYPGKYHHKDICVKGWISSFDGRQGYIVGETNHISNDIYYDFSLSGKKENRIIRFHNYNDDKEILNENLQVGDYITIYGNLFDQRLYSKKFNVDSYGREFGDPKAIEIN